MLASNFRPQYLEQQEYAIDVAQIVSPFPLSPLVFSASTFVAFSTACRVGKRGNG